MGSSSSFTVGLIHAIKSLRGQLASQAQLALDAIHVEQNVIGENVGSQDQVTAAYGGFNQVRFEQSGDIVVKPVILPPERRQHLNDHMLLFFTGLTRFASEIAVDQIRNFESRRSELLAMRDMVDGAQSILQADGTDLDAFGGLLHEAWICKRRLSDTVTTPVIDQYYDAARAAGALGGKLLGAGGGGFLLMFAPPERHGRIREALPGLVHVPFRFESGGSNVVLYQPEGL